ncbi:MAG: FixH family protein [Hyphomicrobiales bacterium]
MRIWKTLLAGAAVAISFVGLAQACEFSADWSPMVHSSDGLKVALSKPDRGIKVSQRFDLEFAVCGVDDTKIDGIDVDAIMPAHKHGMNYRPIVTRLDEGRYKASGMLFHMPGEWQVIVDVLSEKSPQRHTLDLAVQ